MSSAEWTIHRDESTESSLRRLGDLFLLFSIPPNQINSLGAVFDKLKKKRATTKRGGPVVVVVSAQVVQIIAEKEARKGPVDNGGSTALWQAGKKQKEGGRKEKKPVARRRPNKPLTSPSGSPRTLRRARRHAAPECRWCVRPRLRIVSPPRACCAPRQFDAGTWPPEGSKCWVR